MPIGTFHRGVPQIFIAFRKSYLIEKKETKFWILEISFGALQMEAILD